MILNHGLIEPNYSINIKYWKARFQLNKH